MSEAVRSDLEPPATEVRLTAQHSAWGRVDTAVLVGVVAFIVVIWAWGNDLAATTEIGLGVPPLHSSWQPRCGIGSLAAMAVGVAMAWWGPAFLHRVGWRWVVVSVVVGAAAWGMALASNDGVAGWTRGVSPTTDYATVASEVDAPASFLEDFVPNIDNGAHPSHVAGHPPGFVLVLWAMRTVGLGGTGWVAALCIGTGSAALACVLETTRRVAGEKVARDAAPFLVLSPAAIWLVTTADAFFAFAAALSVALLCAAVLRRDRRSDAVSAVGGIALGVTLLLSYGLVLIVAIPAVIAWRERRMRPLVIGGIAAAVTLLSLVPFGFWWLDGLQASRHRYWSGFAATRPFTYFFFANLAALALCIGPSIWVALKRVRSSPVVPLVAGALIAIALANVSAMSKAEVERIWLPFAIWLLPAGAVLASRRSTARTALLCQVGTAVVLQGLLHSA